MARALVEGWKACRRSWGLVVALLVVNVLMAAVLAVPLASTMEKDLAQTDSAQTMLYGFDFPWWSEWSDRQSGFTASFGPDLFGIGFAFKNVEALLQGNLPAGLFVARARPDAPAAPSVDGVILGMGALYLIVQTFLLGGILATLRGPQGAWTVRSLLHGSGFYFGRMVRVAALALVLDFILFRANGPFASWIDRLAREAVSERSALALTLGRHAFLLFLLLVVNLLSLYAKVIVVVEERSSALLAWVSAVGFWWRHLLRTTGHYFLVALLGVVLLALWRVLDGAWATTGYKTQLVTFLLFQSLLFSRLALRLILMGGQVSLYRRLGLAPAAPIPFTPAAEAAAGA
jgi:hypothetical protein